MMSSVMRGGRRRAHMLTALRSRHHHHHFVIVHARPSSSHNIATRITPEHDETLRQHHRRVLSTRDTLELIFTQAVRRVADAQRARGPTPALYKTSAKVLDARVVPCERETARFGDYQCNDAMRLFQQWSGTKTKKKTKKRKKEKEMVEEEVETSMGQGKDDRDDRGVKQMSDVVASTGEAAERVMKSPRDVASAIVAAIDERATSGGENAAAAVIAETSIAGPGFINVRLRPQYLASKIMAMMRDARGLRSWAPTKIAAQRCVVDYSSPNIAKEMHVGHLRSTIIGDTLANVMDFCGADVLRLNHVGDWGTQFGMLIEYMRETQPALAARIAEGADGDGGTTNVDDDGGGEAARVSVGDLQSLYRDAKRKFDADAEFKTRAQESVVRLQQGDVASERMWRAICEASRQEFDAIYGRLGIAGLVERGESFYNPKIPGVLAELEERQIAVVDDGALCVFPFGAGEDEVPLIVQKSDGGYNYASTDLAALRQRIDDEHADWIVYVTDVGQKAHFDKVFATARLAGWLPPSPAGGDDDDVVDDDDVGCQRVSHVSFGLVLGEDGKRFRTRSGDVVRLADLLDEAKRRCMAQLRERDAIADESDMERVAETLGYGAIKYADLSNNRQSNYVFSFDRMLDMKGNTAVYMQYAHARIASIVDKSGVDIDNVVATGSLQLDDDAERRLALAIVQFPEALDATLDDLMPSRICDYMYDLSSRFNEFYSACSVLQSEDSVRTSRLILCEATARVLRQCFHLLGVTPLMRL